MYILQELIWRGFSFEQVTLTGSAWINFNLIWEIFHIYYWRILKDSHIGKKKTYCLFLLIDFMLIIIYFVNSCLYVNCFSDKLLSFICLYSFDVSKYSIGLYSIENPFEKVFWINKSMELFILILVRIPRIKYKSFPIK